MDKATNSYSRLLQDLMSLERDFKNNVNLLNIKDEEIERCKVTNEKLWNTLKTRETQIQMLEYKIFNLEADVTREKSNTENERRFNQETTRKLTDELNSAKMKIDRLKNEHKTELSKKEQELKEEFNVVLREKEKQFQINVMAVEERLHQEKISASLISQRLQKELDGSISLQNKMRELENKYSSEKSFLQEEIVSLKNANSSFILEIESLRSKYRTLQSSLTSSSSEIKKYQEDLKILNLEIKNITEKNAKLSLENESLKRKLKEASLIYGNARLEAEALNKKNYELQSILEDCNNAGCCSNEEHCKFDELVKQNAILQEVIRTMRKDRSNNELQNKQSIYETECRIERLENLVMHLKTFYEEN